MAGMTSCSNDDVVVEQPKVLEEDQSFYANIAICSTDAMTRADSNDGNANDTADDTPKYDDGTIYDNTKDPKFDRGTDVENDIKSIFLIFYDADGKRVSTTQVRKDNEAGGTYDTTSPTPSAGDVIYSGVVQIDVKHGSQMPAYVMCFVNPITSSNFDINPDFETLESLQATTRPRIIDDNNVFAMSKSVYWGYDPVEDEENQKIVATPLFSKESAGYAGGSNNVYQIFNTYEEAANAGGESIVNIYVERYAAKVSLKIESDATTKDITLTSSDYTLKFTPEFWAVNAYESNTYVCKSFNASDGSGLSFAQLQEALAGYSNDLTNLWHWNSETLHRCYWAQTPAYYSGEYPRVADDIKDNGAGEYALGYYSYQDMVKNANGSLIAKARGITLGQDSAIYARENTVSGNALKTAANNPEASAKAAIASAVIVGNYELYDKEIWFDNLRCEVGSLSGLSIRELQAINEKVKELGWLKDE